MHFVLVMNQRYKKRKRVRAHNYSQGLWTGLGEKKRLLCNIDVLSFGRSFIKKKKQSWKRSLMSSTVEMKLQQSSGSCANNTACEDHWPHHVCVTFTTGWDGWEKRWMWHGVRGLPWIFYRNIKSIHIPRLCWEFLFYRRWCLFKQRSWKRTRPIGRTGRGRQMMMNTKEISSALTANKSRHFIIFHIY